MSTRPNKGDSSPRRQLKEKRQIAKGGNVASRDIGEPPGQVKQKVAILSPGRKAAQVQAHQGGHR